MTGSDRIRQTLADLADSGPDRSGRIWQNLTESGKHWWTQAYSGRLWQTLADSVRYWQKCVPASTPA